MGSVWKQIFSISFIGPLISFHFIHFTPPGVTSERQLARSTRRYIGTALRGALYSLSYLLFFVCCKINANIQGVYHRPNLERACNVGCRLFSLSFYHLHANISRWQINRKRKTENSLIVYDTES